MHAPALIGQKKAVDASIWPPLQQAAALHFVQQLAHVTLGDQERVGKLLLADPFGGTDLGQYVELGRAELTVAQRLGRCAVDLLEDANQAQPGQQAWRSNLAWRRRHCAKCGIRRPPVKSVLTNSIDVPALRPDRRCSAGCGAPRR